MDKIEDRHISAPVENKGRPLISISNDMRNKKKSSINKNEWNKRPIKIPMKIKNISKKM